MFQGLMKKIRLMTVNSSRPGPRCSTDGEKRKITFSHLTHKTGCNPQDISSRVNGSETGVELMNSGDDEWSINVDRNSEPSLLECGPRCSKDSQTFERFPSKPRNKEMRHLLSMITRFKSPVAGEMNSQHSIDVNIDEESFWNRKSDTDPRDCAEVVTTKTQKISHLLDKSDADEELVENYSTDECSNDVNLSWSGPRRLIAGGESTPKTRAPCLGLTGNNSIEIESAADTSDGETVPNEQRLQNEISNTTAEEDKTKNDYMNKDYSLSCKQKISQPALLKYNCWHCKEFYGTERELGWHLSKEFPQHLYMCLYCPKEITFDSEDLYRKHTLCHEEQDGAENRFVIFCRHCDDTCDTEEAMNAHIQNLHSHDIASTISKSSGKPLQSKTSSSDDTDGRSSCYADQREKAEEERIIEQAEERNANDEFHSVNLSSNSAEDDAMLVGPSTRSRTQAKLIQQPDSNSGIIECDTNNEKTRQSLYLQCKKNSTSHPEQLEEQKSAHCKKPRYTSRSRCRKLGRGSSLKSQSSCQRRHKTGGELRKSITCDVVGTEEEHIIERAEGRNANDEYHSANLSSDSAEDDAMLAGPSTRSRTRPKLIQLSDSNSGMVECDTNNEKTRQILYLQSKKNFTSHPEQLEQQKLADLNNSITSRSRCRKLGRGSSLKSQLTCQRRHRTGGKLRKSITCDVCGKLFWQISNLYQHKRAVHDKERPYVCKVCGKSFTQNCTLRAHKRAIHDKEKPYICNVCGKSFPWFGSLYLHKRAIHDKEKPYTCNVCGKSFARSSTLYLHKRAIHDKEKPYTCNVCGKSFARSSTLYLHKRAIHDKEKPYTCNACEKSFACSSTFYQHKRAIHDKERPYTCNVCGKSFALSGHLYRHKRSIHDKKRPYTCNVCGKSFTESGTLHKHKRTIHDKEKPYTCNVCGKSFTESGNLYHHKRTIHDKEKPHTCNACGKSFARLDY